MANISTFTHTSNVSNAEYRIQLKRPDMFFPWGFLIGYRLKGNYKMKAITFENSVACFGFKHK